MYVPLSAIPEEKGGIPMKKTEGFEYKSMSALVPGSPLDGTIDIYHLIQMLSLRLKMQNVHFSSLCWPCRIYLGTSLKCPSFVYTPFTAGHPANWTQTCGSSFSGRSISSSTLESSNSPNTEISDSLECSYDSSESSDSSSLPSIMKPGPSLYPHFAQHGKLSPRIKLSSHKSTTILVDAFVSPM